MPCTKAEAQLPTPMIATRTFSCWWRTSPLGCADWPLVGLTKCLSLLEGLPGTTPAVRSRLRAPQLGVDVPDSLEDGECAQHREDVDRRGEQIEVAERGAAGEDQADREDHDANRAGRDADLALDAERLGARTRVGDHQRGQHGYDDR